MSNITDLTQQDIEKKQDDKVEVDAESSINPAMKMLMDKMEKMETDVSTDPDNRTYRTQMNEEQSISQRVKTCFEQYANHQTVPDSKEVPRSTLAGSKGGHVRRRP